MSITNIIKNNKNVNINIYNFKDKECYNDELFKRINGYDNYSVSNQGRVRYTAS